MTVSNRAHFMKEETSIHNVAYEHGFGAALPGDVWLDLDGEYAIKTDLNSGWCAGTLGNKDTWYITNGDGSVWHTGHDHVVRCIQNSIGASGGTSVPANVVNNIDMDRVADAIRSLETTINNRTDYSYNVHDELRQIKEIMQLRSEAEHKRKRAVEEFSLFG